HRRVDEREKNEAKNRKLNTFAMIFNCSDLDGNTVQFSMAIYTDRTSYAWSSPNNAQTPSNRIILHYHYSQNSLMDLQHIKDRFAFRL
ncbi:MAG: hypothetical protein AB7D40_08285, partial [Bacteroidales bacterium]